MVFKDTSLTICIVSLGLSLHYLIIIAVESCGLPKLNNLFFSDPEGMAEKLQLRPHPILQTLILQVPLGVTMNSTENFLF